VFPVVKASHAAAGAEPAAGDRDRQAIERGQDRAPLGVAAMPARGESAELLAPKRGPGRPQGRGNIRDEEAAQRLIEQYGDPLEADVAIGNMPPAQLAATLRAIASDCGLKLGMDVGAIVRFQRECRASAMPFLHSKRLAVAVTPQPALPVFGLARGPGAAGGSIGAGFSRSIEDVIDVPAKEQSEQGLSGEAAPVSETDKSDDAPSD
jgi:hypothetical protein